MFLLIGFLLMAGFFQHQYDSRFDYFVAKKVFVTLPSGKTLKILSVGYQEVVSDLIFIWAIQLYGSYNITNRFEYIEHVFDVITELSPFHKSPYMVGSWIMALELGDIHMAIRLLQKGRRNMPEDWEFDFESGYYAQSYLKDYEMARRFFERAIKVPGTPHFVKRNWAHVIYMKNDLQKAFVVWMDIYKNATTLIARDSAIHHLYQIKLEMDKPVLDRAIGSYRKRYGKFPASLDVLIRSGDLSRLPRDFYGNIYRYDPKNGKIIPRKVLKWKKLT